MTLVDLFTTSDTIHELMITSFPARIIGEAHRREEVARTHQHKITLSSFMGLDERTLIRFLDQNRQSLSPIDEYEIRDSETGRHIEMYTGGELLKGKMIETHIAARALDTYKLN